MTRRSHSFRSVRWALGVAAALAPWLVHAAGERPAPRAEGNRIEVSGNHASGVRVACDRDGRRASANINSVNVDGRALKGETVIVTGRNTRDVVVQDCPPTVGGQPATGGGVNINSVNIR